MKPGVRMISHLGFSFQRRST